MPTATQCPRCDTPVPADAPDGLCPSCVVNEALRGELGNSMLQLSSADGAEPAMTVPEVSQVAAMLPHLEVLRELGRGGMGVVYLARQPKLDRLVALKLLPSELGKDASFSERFSREARSLARLSHPNIVTVFNSGQVGEFSYFLMEYVDGSTLRGLLQEGALDPAEALELVPQICAGLQYAHDQGLVHRDLKPENILITEDGRVKIADFGLAKLLDADSKDATLTLTNQRMGTPHYMAPEQIRLNAPMDHRVDIYALGVLLYELLTRQLPIGRFAPPSEIAGTHTHLDAVVLRCLESNPDRRFQQVKDLQEGLAGKSLAKLVKAKPVFRPVLDPEADHQRVLDLLDATERGSNWSVLHYVGSVLSAGLVPLVRAERLLGWHTAENGDRYAPVGSEQGRRTRYRTAAVRNTQRGARRRMVLSVLLFLICLPLCVGGVVAFNNNPHSHYREVEVGRWDGVHKQMEYHYNPRRDRWYDLTAAAGGIGGGLWGLTLLGMLVLHTRAVQKHERQQLCLGILDQGVSSEEAEQALSAHRHHWLVHSVGTGAMLVAAISVSIPLVVPFLLALPFMIGRALSSHAARERKVPALGCQVRELPSEV